MSQQVPHPDCEVCTGEAPAASLERERLKGIEALAYQAFVDVLDGTIPVEGLGRRAHILVDDFALHLLTPYAEPTPNSEANTNSVLSNDELVVEIRALLKALEKIIAEVSERRVGHREKIAEIARTAIDQARGD